MMRRREFITLVGGAAASWPLGARAHSRQRSQWLDSCIRGRQQPNDQLGVEPFRRGLQEIGYIEGRNVGIEFRWADGEYDRLPALAADLVGRQVSVIVAALLPAARAAKAATGTHSHCVHQRLGPDRVSAGHEPKPADRKRYGRERLLRPADCEAAPAAAGAYARNGRPRCARQSQQSEHRV